MGKLAQNQGQKRSGKIIYGDEVQIWQSVKLSKCESGKVRSRRSAKLYVKVQIWQSAKPSKCKAVEVQIWQSVKPSKCKAVEDKIWQREKQS
jgi:hypothetical protein